MPEQKNKLSLNDIIYTLKLGNKGYDLLGSAGIIGGNNVAIGGETLSTFAGGPGVADVVAPTATGAGPGTAMAGGAFWASYAAMAAKILRHMTEDRPAVTFRGGKATTIIPSINGGGRDSAGSKDSATVMPPGAYVSDKFDFNIGTKDLQGKDDEISRDVGQYLDTVFTEMQKNTSVDINKIIPHAFELTDISGGEKPKEMADRVIKMVGEGIKTGKPINPYYSRNRSLENTKYGDMPKDQYFTGTEGYDPNQERYDNLTGREREDSIDPSILATRDQKNNGEEFSRGTYAPIESIEGDPNFVMPDISNVGAESVPQDKETFSADDNKEKNMAQNNENNGIDNTFWESFKSKWFDDPQNAELLYKQDAEHIASAANEFNDTNQAAADKQSAYLDELRGQYAKPLSFNVGGNDISFVPRGSRNTISELGETGQTDMENQQTVAKDKLTTAPITSPSVGGVNYLEALKGILSGENDRNKTASDDAYKSGVLDISQQEADIEKFLADESVKHNAGMLDYYNKNIGLGQQRIDQQDPGLFGHIGGGVSILDGIFGASKGGTSLWEGLTGLFD